MGSIQNPTIKEEFFKVIKEFKIWVEKEFSDSIWRNFFQKTVWQQEHTAT